MQAPSLFCAMGRYSKVQNSLNIPALDIQEALKVLRFRFRRDVGFRPVRGSGGLRYYSVDGRLCAEAEILLWAERGRMPVSRGGPVA